MIAALLITLASVVVGATLAVVTSRVRTLLDGLRTFAITAIATLAAVELLPESVERLGPTALLLFVGALALPPVFASVAGRIRERDEPVTAHAVGAELGYFGFVAHQFVEGIALATYAGPDPQGHDRMELVIAVAAHTVPMTALFIGTVLVQRGKRPALRRVLGLLVASTSGFFAARWVSTGLADAVAPTLAALVAGFLCHVLLHGVGPTRRRPTSVRLLDVLAVAAGIALPLSAAQSDADGGLQIALAHAWVELAFATAPMLVIGLMLGTGLGVLRRRPRGRGSQPQTASEQALYGISIGAPLPLCACGVVPAAEALRGRKAGAGAVVAFLISAPELGPETLTLTVGFMGWPFAAVRVAAALLLAYVVGMGVARFAAPGPGHPVAHPDESAHAMGHGQPVSHGLLTRAWGCFDELLLRTAPWTIVGLLAAAYVMVAFPTDALAPLADAGVDIVVVAVVAMLTYVCAAAATPMAAVLMLKGVSSGALLVGLLLGPATNVATITMLGRAYGRRTAWLGVAMVAGVSCLLGVALNLADLPLPRAAGLEGANNSGLVSWGSVALLIAGLMSQLWRWGLGPWLQILDAGGHAHGHGHGHPHDDSRD